MTENTNDQPTLVVATGLSDATITATKIGQVIPDAYRLVRFHTEDGQVHLKLQGYFTWTQGWSERGGEWRDIETVDADDLSDDKPYGRLS
jgi:hypothetical protein